MTAAGAACRMSTSEVRAKKDQGPDPAVKIALCESMLAGMRGKLWDGKSWGPVDIDKRMRYLGCLYGYDMSARVSEYTANEVGGQDHCLRAGDITFEMKDGTSFIGVPLLYQRIGWSDQPGTGLLDQVGFSQDRDEGEGQVHWSAVS